MHLNNSWWGFQYAYRLSLTSKCLNAFILFYIYSIWPPTVNGSPSKKYPNTLEFGHFFLLSLLLSCFGCEQSRHTGNKPIQSLVDKSVALAVPFICLCLVYRHIKESLCGGLSRQLGHECVRGRLHTPFVYYLCSNWSGRLWYHFKYVIYIRYPHVEVTDISHEILEPCVFLKQHMSMNMSSACSPLGNNLTQNYNFYLLYVLWLSFWSLVYCVGYRTRMLVMKEVYLLRSFWHIYFLQRLYQ